jgi:hypothetical protein
LRVVAVVAALLLVDMSVVAVVLAATKPHQDCR